MDADEDMSEETLKRLCTILRGEEAT